MTLSNLWSEPHSEHDGLWQFRQKNKDTQWCPLLLERMMGIEPTRSAWKAEVLPLNYIRIFSLTQVLLYHIKIFLSMIFL